MKRILNSLTAIVVICSLFLNLNFVYAENVPTIKISCQKNPVSFANAICNDIQKRTGEKFVFVRKSIGKGLVGIAYLLKGSNVDLCLKIFQKKQHTLQHNIYYNITGEDFDPNFLKHILNPKTPHLNFPVAGYESRSFYGTISKYNNMGTLKDLIESGQRLDQKQIATIIHDVLTGLNCLHKTNLVHGDVWSANIMLENEEGELRAFIIDFDFLSNANSLSKEGRMLARYDGPENVLFNKKIGFKSEVFSAGIFLWELIYGEAPFGGLRFDTRSKICNKNIKRSSRQLRQQYIKALSELPLHLHVMGNDTNLSPECRDLLSKLLNPDPDLRISAEEALNHSFFNILI